MKIPEPSSEQSALCGLTEIRAVLYEYLALPAIEDRKLHCVVDASNDQLRLRGKMLGVWDHDAVGVLYVSEKRPDQFPQRLVHWGAPLNVTVSDRCPASMGTRVDCTKKPP